PVNGPAPSTRRDDQPNLRGRERLPDGAALPTAAACVPTASRLWPAAGSHRASSEGGVMRLAMTRQPTPSPGRPRTPRRLSELTTHAWFWFVLVPYLAGTFLLLAAVFAPTPHRPGARGAPAAAWNYQREQIAVDGGGVGNAVARSAIGAAAGMAKGSSERERDGFGLNRR